MSLGYPIALPSVTDDYMMHKADSERFSQLARWPSELDPPHYGQRGPMRPNLLYLPPSHSESVSAEEMRHNAHVISPSTFPIPRAMSASCINIGAIPVRPAVVETTREQKEVECL